MVGAVPSALEVGDGFTFNATVQTQAAESFVSVNHEQAVLIDTPSTKLSKELIIGLNVVSNQLCSGITRCITLR